MAHEENSALCRHCGERRLVRRQTANHLLHLVVTVFTAGLWLPIWLLVSLAATGNPWRCTVCGSEIDAAHAPRYKGSAHVGMLVALGALALVIAFAFIRYHFEQASPSTPHTSYNRP